MLLGADPLADCPDADLARRALAGARRIVALDTFLTESAATADVVLAAAAYAEQGGTTTNLEGRVTSLAQQVTVTGTSRPDWMIAAELADRLGLEDLAVELGSLDAITAAHRRQRAGLRRRDARRRRRFATDGVLAVGTGSPDAAAALGDGNVAVPDRISYDYRVVVSRKLYDGAVGHGDVAVARAARRRRNGGREPAGSRPPRRDRWPRGQAHRAAGNRSCCRSPAIPACRAAPSRPVQRRRARRSATSSTPPRPSTTSTSRGCDALDARRRPAALRRPDVDAAADRRRQGPRDLHPRPRRHDVHGLVRAQDDRRAAEPHRAQQGRPVRCAADAWPTG